MKPKNPCIIMDIDGTLANAAHRLHLLPKGTHETGRAPDASWETFFAAADGDSVHEEIRALNNQMAERYAVFMVTGRRESQRAQTEAWLKKHDIHYHYLIMRPDGDYRKDYEVKREILTAIRGMGFEPLFAVEDRKSVTQMWREAGLRCLQVCEGEY